MKIKYENWRPSEQVRIDIRRAEAVCQQYAADGYDLTLRQLYYQFVARGWIENNLKSYKRLGEIVNRARLSGLLDWSYIVDRTRSLRGTSHWRTPGAVIDSAAWSYRLDKWATQPRRVEVWVEKEALAGVVQRAANEADVDWFSCRGYVSQSEQWAAARRFLGYLRNGQAVTVLHLGDHDPSGIDMTRDIRERLELFLSQDWLSEHRAWFDEDVEIAEVLAHMRDQLGDVDPIEIRRIALNSDQVREHNPPPNPAKLTDSRASAYVREHGYESWELDALPPDVLAGLIGQHIEGIRNEDAFELIAAREAHERELLRAAADRWTELAGVLAANGDEG
ncbi:hypothetical protein J2S43_007881 [Catenuloplanes nepalensis]|uniref:DUF2399 domain-containing protein n=1 Tax=Catenuloplanes nepalensis TaxID=587533 RepID=A0ABT9N6Q5_9ACTN|nr:hypothetical protein [Catenuloplanes nepalensis]MDP9799369.1 hypothetical protein [Catenuloplanes nepalensis]